jgi:hypothetical protein
MQQSRVADAGECAQQAVRMDHEDAEFLIDIEHDGVLRD